MQLVRRALIAACGVAMIVGAYFAGAFTAGLLVSDTHAMAAPASSLKPVATEAVDRVAAL